MQEQSVANEPSADLPDVRLRNTLLVRAVLLFSIGMFVTFTATLHEQLSFDITVLAASLALLGAVTLVEYWVMRGTTEAWWLAVRAILALAAAGSFIAVQDVVTMALVLALWALLTAAVTTIRLVRRAQPARIAVPSLLLSVALAIGVLIMRTDAVAVIGLFGAYVLIRGVFLGITAIDSRRAGQSQQSGDSTTSSDSIS